MKEIIKMLVVLTLICAVCGFLLAYVNKSTKKQREEQVLLNVKGPAVKKVLKGSDNDLIKDRKIITIGKKKIIIFVGKKAGKPWAFAYEMMGKGFGGDIGVIVGIDAASGDLLGIGITTHKETPGLGALIQEPGFREGFKGLDLSAAVKVTGDGGQVDAISGATISSRAVCEAVNKASAFYKQHKTEILSLVAPGS